MVKAFDLIAGLTPTTTIRMLANIQDDELLRKLFAFIVCETAGGLSEFPTKSHRVEITKEFINRGVDASTMIDILDISKKTIQRLKNETN